VRNIRLSKNAEKFLKRNPAYFKRLDDEIEQLAIDPTPKGSIKLQGLPTTGRRYSHHIHIHRTGTLRSRYSTARARVRLTVILPVFYPTAECAGKKTTCVNEYFCNMPLMTAAVPLFSKEIFSNQDMLLQLLRSRSNEKRNT